MERVTKDDLRGLLYELNDLTKEDKYPYQFYIAYGSYGLDKVVNEGRGTRTIIGLTTKRDLYYQMENLIKGIRIGKGEK